MFSVLIHIEESTAPLLRKANIWRVELSSNTALIKMGNETVCSEVFGCLSLVGFSWVLLTWISTVCFAKGTCMYPEHEKEVACWWAYPLWFCCSCSTGTTMPLLVQESWLPTLWSGIQHWYLRSSEGEVLQLVSCAFSSTADGLVGLISLTL